MTCVVSTIRIRRDIANVSDLLTTVISGKPESDGKPMTHEGVAERASTNVFRDFADTPGVEIRIKHDNGAEVS